jgi:predicted nucleotidyltransferase
MGKLSDALFTETRQRVLGLLYGSPESSFFLKEILRRTGMGVGTVKRELDRLYAAGILSLRKVGNQHHYYANQECPIYNELCAIVRKTTGLVDPLALALAPLEKQIDHAFVFGSLASGKESSGSDIDLMIIGSVAFSSVVKALHPVQEELGREINPKIYRKSEWEERQQAKDSFVISVIESPQLDVICKTVDSVDY